MDVFFKNTLDGGEIDLFNGDVVTKGSMETLVYLSLFGGYDWWGRGLNSETQKILDGSPPTSANAVRLNDAVKRDLSWLITEGLATDVDSELTYGSVPGRVDILATVSGVGEFKFSEIWKADVNGG